MITTSQQFERKFLDVDVLEEQGQASAMVFTEQISKIDPNIFKVRYKITQKDWAKMNKWIVAGDYEMAIEFFTNKYLEKMSKDYYGMIKYALMMSSSRVLAGEKLKVLNDNIVKISNSIDTEVRETTRTLTDLVLDNRKKIFGALGWLHVDKYTLAIMKNTSFYNLGQAVGVFMFLNTRKTHYYMSRIQQQVIKKYGHLKRYEKETEPSRRIELLKKIAIVNDIRKHMKETNKEVLGQVSKKIYKGVSERRLKEFMEREITDTILDVTNENTESMALLNDEDILEYYQSSHREIKTKPRVVCKEVMGQTILGKSLVALTSSASHKLGIPMLDDVKARAGLGKWCRHAVRPVSIEFLAELNKKFGAFAEEFKNPKDAKEKLGTSGYERLEDARKGFYNDKDYLRQMNELERLNKVWGATDINIHSFKTPKEFAPPWYACANGSFITFNSVYFQKKEQQGMYDGATKKFQSYSKKQYEIAKAEYEKSKQKLKESNWLNRGSRQFTNDNDKKRYDYHKRQMKFKRWNAFSSAKNCQQDITSHEYGHVISDQYFGQVRGFNTKGISDKKMKSLNNRWLKIDKKMKKDNSIFKISAYADCAYYENFAECFSMYNNKERKLLPQYTKNFMNDISKLAVTDMKKREKEKIK